MSETRSAMNTRNSSNGILKKSQSTPSLTAQSTNNQLEAISEVQTINEEDTEAPSTSGTAPVAPSPVITDTATTNEILDTDVVEEANFPSEEEIMKLAWNLYSSKEQELRATHHIEYLSTCVSESLTPKGLQIKLRPSMQDKELECKWKQILHNTSQELLKLLIEHHGKRLQEIEKERKTLDQRINIVWDQEDKESIVKDVEDSLASREEELKARSMRKLERDRRQQQNVANDQPVRITTSKPKYSDLIRRHIQDKIKETSANDPETNQNKSFSEVVKQRATTRERGTAMNRKPSYKHNNQENDNNNHYRQRNNRQNTYNNRDKTEQTHFRHGYRNSNTNQPPNRRYNNENFGYRGRRGYWR